MKALSVTYASSPSSDLLIPTLEFNNETAGVIRLLFFTYLFLALSQLAPIKSTTARTILKIAILFADALGQIPQGGANRVFTIKALNSCTISLAGGLIDGAATLAIPANTTATIISDGTNGYNIK